MKENEVAFNLNEILGEDRPGRQDRGLEQSEFEGKQDFLGRVSRWGAAWRNYNKDQKPFLTKDDVDDTIGEADSQ